VLLAEDRVLAATGVEAVIVRPRFVWGKDDTTLLPRIVAAAREGRCAWIGGGRFLTSTCMVTASKLLRKNHPAQGR
jgi:hypothetical protein